MTLHSHSDDTAAPSFDSATGAYTFTHDWNTDGPLWMRLVDAVEAIPRVDTPETPFLFEAVDPEALDALFAPVSDGRSRSAGVVVVPVAGTLVAVWADGTVQIRRPEGSDAN